MPTVTIDDIAKKAGVSTATVSRVINHSPSVTASTREKVNQIILEMNYSPSVIARNLSKNKTTTIGVIIPQIDNPFFGHALRGIWEITNRHGYAIMCFNTDDEFEKDLSAINTMKEYRIAGLLFTPAISYSTKKQKNSITSHLKKLECPIVCFDRRMAELSLDDVVFDDETAVYEAVSKMILAGHKKIGLINGSENSFLGNIRLKGYLKALNGAGLPVEQKYMFFGNLRNELGYQHAKKMLSMDDRPSAVMLCNNEITCGFLRALEESGMQLGKDIHCVGLDKIEPLDVLNIGLNYIERDAEVLGRTAADLLFRRIQHPNEPKEHIYLTPKVVTPYL